MTLLNCIEKGINQCFALIPRKAPITSSFDEVCLIAHRGAHDKKERFVENTEAAFANALALGCWGIEFDVRATADNVLVVNHDPCLSRLWGKDAAINSLDFKSLRQMAPEIPSLSEIIERYGRRMHLFIELKAPFTAESILLANLKSLNPVENYHLISLSEPLLASLSKIPKAAMLLVPLHHNVSEFCTLSIQKHYGGVLGHYLLMTNHKIQQLRKAKQCIGVGFIDSKWGLYREVNRGLNWLFTNKARQMAAYLQTLHPY